MLEIKVRNPGAELTSVKFNGKERLHDGKTFWDRQAPILFPTVGRLRDNKTVIEGKEYKIPQHGFAKDMDFELIEKTKNKEIYELKSNEETLKKYPFKFVLNIEYEFTEDILTTKIRVINKDDKNMIFGLGGHPGFKLEMPQEEYYFELEAEEPEVEFMEVEGNYISNKLAKNILKENKIIEITKESFLNDAIMMKKLKSNKITLKQKKGNKKVLEFNFKDFPILAIWSLPGALYICLEPWFNYADRVKETAYFKDKEGIINLRPKEEFECEFSVTFF